MHTCLSRAHVFITCCTCVRVYTCWCTRVYHTCTRVYQYLRFCVSFFEVWAFCNFTAVGYPKNPTWTLSLYLYPTEERLQTPCLINSITRHSLIASRLIHISDNLFTWTHVISLSRVCMNVCVYNSPIKSKKLLLSSSMYNDTTASDIPNSWGIWARLLDENMSSARVNLHKP